MPTTEIRETTVTPDASGLLVQIHISDSSQPDVAPAIHITLAVRVPAYEAPLLAHLHRTAMDIAYTALGDLREQAAAEIRKTRLDLKPSLRG